MKNITIAYEIIQNFHLELEKYPIYKGKQKEEEEKILFDKEKMC